MFEKNDRVELVSTSDPYTRLTPGTKGTVYSVRENFGELTINVSWDDGSTLSMIPSEGDRLRKV